MTVQLVHRSRGRHARQRRGLGAGLKRFLGAELKRFLLRLLPIERGAARRWRDRAVEFLCLLATVVLGALAAAAVVMTLLILWWLAWQLAVAAVLLAGLGVGEHRLVAALRRLKRAVDEEAQR